MRRRGHGGQGLLPGISRVGHHHGLPHLLGLETSPHPITSSPRLATSFPCPTTLSPCPTISMFPPWPRPTMAMTTSHHGHGPSWPRRTMGTPLHDHSPIPCPTINRPPHLLNLEMSPCPTTLSHHAVPMSYSPTLCPTTTGLPHLDLKMSPHPTTSSPHPTATSLRSPSSLDRDVDTPARPIAMYPPPITTSLWSPGL